MSLKALARQALERNAPGNCPRNTPENRATLHATAAAQPAQDWEERAAIIEDGAQAPREWAEGFARLTLAPPPSGVLPGEWASVIDAAGHFLDRWAGRAHQLGWTAAELFGLDPDAPLNRLDRRGAAFFLARREVVAITAEELTVRSGGVIQRIRRKPNGALPAWEVWGAE